MAGWRILAGSTSIQVGTFLGQRQVADLINDKQCGTAHLAKFLVQLSGGDDAAVFHRHIETMAEISREVRLGRKTGIVWRRRQIGSLQRRRMPVSI